MTPLITKLDPVTKPLHRKTVLAREGFACSILMLAPGDETPRYDASEIEEHLLFVIEGDATVRFGDVNTILGQDQALLVPKGKEHSIAAQPNGLAKVLQIDLTSPQIVNPPIFALDG